MDYIVTTKRRVAASGALMRIKCSWAEVVQIARDTVAAELLDPSLATELVEVQIRDSHTTLGAVYTDGEIYLTPWGESRAVFVSSTLRAIREGKIEALALAAQNLEEFSACELHRAAQHGLSTWITGIQALEQRIDQSAAVVALRGSL